ncbi:GntR family transcriptional regulator [Streptomyces sp. NPDC041068]|uniref:GntR family transcriptional regulator n=1 Tax=Streptomyces sp. NPDC041068 TaxID=3155130 RepID=UPI0033D4E20F
MAVRGDSAYARLARELREAILRHDFPDGVRLPTEAELAAAHGVSRQTVRRAFQDLVAEGLVDRAPGRGTFAAPQHDRHARQFGSVEDLMALPLDTTMRLVSPLRRMTDPDAAARLRLGCDRVDRVAFLRLHEATPFCLTNVSLPPEVGELLTGLPELTEKGPLLGSTVIGMLDGRLPHPIAQAEQSVTVTLADSAACEHLGCPPEHPLLRIDRLYVSTAGHPVELAISRFLPEHYTYRVRLRRRRC